MHLLPLMTLPLPQIDRFLYSTDNQVVAGALLAVGIVNCGVQDEVDPALALLAGELLLVLRVGCVLLSGWSKMGWTPHKGALLAGQPGGIKCLEPHCQVPGLTPLGRTAPPDSTVCCPAPPSLPPDYVGKDDPQTRIGAILGLGIAYAGRWAGVLGGGTGCTVCMLPLL